MKRIFTLLLVLLGLNSVGAQNLNSMAHPDAVVNRRLPVPEFSTEEKDGYLEIKTSALTIKYKIGGVIDGRHPSADVLNISFNLNGRQVLWYPGKDDALNLKGTTRTLDGQIGDNKRQELENGLLSTYASW